MLSNENGNPMVMPVQPMYGGGFGNGGIGFGGDWAWILLLLVLGGGWGGFGFGGMGGMLGAGMMGGMYGMDFLYPWLNNSQNINDGFRDQQLNDSVGSVRDGISALSTQLCNCGHDIQQGISNGFSSVNKSITDAQFGIAQQMNANEVANLNRSFAEQTANAQGFTAAQAGIADLKYTVASENCADRYEAAQNTNAIIAAVNAGIQSIKDDICADRLANAQREVEAERRENNNLRTQLSMAQLSASQTAQNAFISQGFANEVDALYNRLKSCPVNTVPVYGNQPVFTCQNNGCGCNGNFG